MAKLNTPDSAQGWAATDGNVSASLENSWVISEEVKQCTDCMTQQPPV